MKAKSTHPKKKKTEESRCSLPSREGILINHDVLSDVLYPSKLSSSIVSIVNSYWSFVHRGHFHTVEQNKKTIAQ